MKDSKEWSRLDNAAKIFPPTSGKRDTKVFRFACELNGEVDAAVLQHALDKTVERFPLYRSTLKKGLFWHYFEESDLRPEVAEETLPLCAPLYSPDRPGLLFRVLYYRRRISLEVFHAVADGSGAMQFLRTLVFLYIMEKHGDEIAGSPELGGYEASLEQRRTDAFRKYYARKNKGARPARSQRAYRIRSERLPEERLGVIEGQMSARAVLEEAHKWDATMSEFLTALLILAIYDCMEVRHRSRPVVITVPVDLRRFFPTQTARNFFGVINVTHHFLRDGDTFADVVESVRRSFKEQLVQENMLGILNRYAAIESNPVVKLIPLALKIPCLKLAGWWSEGADTAAISNIGRITMPEAVAPYIRLFDVLLYTVRPQICLCSYGDMLVVSISSPLRTTEVQRCFFSRLAAMGVEIHIVSSLEEETTEGGAPDAVL